MKTAIRIVLLLTLTLLATEGISQNLGQIFKPATGTRSNGQLVLDPNGDGFVSKASCGTTGFSGACADDLTHSEIPFFALPTPITEPLSDLKTGGGGGHTDIVAGVDDSGSMMWSDSQFLYFRIRIKTASTASKGYTFLINTNTTAFGTVTSGNPGFQYEVVLQTGGGSAGVNVYNYTSVPNNGTASFVYGLSTHFQKAVSGNDIITNAPAYFYTFYVPWSDLATIGFTNTMPFRAAAATITSSNSGINGTVSDINGINDSAFGSLADAFAAVINAFPPTSGSGLQTGGFPPARPTRRSSPPVSTSPAPAFRESPPKPLSQVSICLEVLIMASAGPRWRLPVSHSIRARAPGL